MATLPLSPPTGKSRVFPSFRNGIPTSGPVGTPLPTLKYVATAELKKKGMSLERRTGTNAATAVVNIGRRQCGICLEFQQTTQKRSMVSIGDFRPAFYDLPG